MQAEGGGGQLHAAAFVDGISIINQMASTETPSPFAADFKMSRLPATRAAAAACSQE
jgi:hypothetical protein